MVDMYHTKCNLEVVEPNWDETFEFDFDEDLWDQPLMIIFDIFGSAGKNRQDYHGIFEAGDHLGSAMIPIASIGDEDAFMNGKGRHKLGLLGDCQLYEKRLGEREKRP